MKIWKELKHRLEKGMETASQKSQQMVEISRLSLRIRGKKDDINRLYRRLGILTFEAWQGDKGDRLVPNREMTEVLRSIRKIQEDITALERELLLVRGKVDCPSCGAVLDLRTEKCPVCQTFIRHSITPTPDESFTTAEPQETHASSHHRQSEPFASQTGSTGQNEQVANEENRAKVPDSRLSLAEFHTVTGEAILICPECGNQLKELVETCPFCGERFR